MRKNENGYIEKRSSEFRGADRCKVLRNYDGLNGILDTVKESNFDEAILMKDLMNLMTSRCFCRNIEKLRQNAFVNYSCARQILRSAK